MRFVNQVPVVSDWWNRSSARQGAALALALVKSHHPELSFNTVTSGFPIDPASGEAMSDEAAFEIITATSAYAGLVERYVITDNFVSDDRIPA